MKYIYFLFYDDFSQYMNFFSFLLVHLINFIISDTAIGQPHLAGKDFCSWLLYFKSYCVVLHYLPQCRLWCYDLSLGHVCSGCQCYTVYAIDN